MTGEQTSSSFKIVPSSEADLKIAVMCGALGAAFGATAFLLVKTVQKRTIEGVDILLEGMFKTNQEN